MLVTDRSLTSASRDCCFERNAHEKGNYYPLCPLLKAIVLKLKNSFDVSNNVWYLSRLRLLRGVESFFGNGAHDKASNGTVFVATFGESID